MRPPSKSYILSAPTQLRQSAKESPHVVELANIHEQVPDIVLSIPSGHVSVVAISMGGLGDDIVRLSAFRAFLAKIRTQSNLPIYSVYFSRGAGSFIQRTGITHHAIPLGHKIPYKRTVTHMRDMFDVLLDLRYVGRVYAQAEFQSLSSDENWIRQWGDYYYKHPEGCEILSAVGRCYEVLLSSLDLPVNTPTLTMDLLPAERKKATALPKPYIVFAIGTDSALESPFLTKSASLNLLRAVAYELILRGFNIVEIGDSVTPSLGIPGIINLIGKTTLFEATAILQQAHDILCVEGGIAHLTAALSISSVVLFGPTDPKFWGYDIHRNIHTNVCAPCWLTQDYWYLFCPKKIGVACMHSITPEQVLEKLRCE